MKLYLDAKHALVFEAEMPSPPSERILIRAGSEASRTTKKATGGHHVDRKDLAREELVRDGVLVPYLRNPKLLIFTRDYEFESPGAAAEILIGRNLSARTAWREVGSNLSLFDKYGPK